MAATRPGFPVHFHQGYSEIPRKAPSYVLSRSLAASTAESFTVPLLSNGVLARYVLFSGSADFYVQCYGTATVPGDVADGTAAELNPSGYQIPPDVDTLSVISASACVVTASFYA